MTDERYSELADILHAEYFELNDDPDFSFTYLDFLKHQDELASSLIEQNYDADFWSEVQLVARREIDRIEDIEGFASECFG